MRVPIRSAGSRSGRELHALERRVDGAGEGADGEGLGQARQALQQNVALRHVGYDDPVDQGLLAHDDLRDLRFYFTDEVVFGLHLLGELFNFSVIHGTTPYNRLVPQQLKYASFNTRLMQ